MGGGGGGGVGEGAKTKPPLAVTPSSESERGEEEAQGAAITGLAARQYLAERIEIIDASGARFPVIHLAWLGLTWVTAAALRA